MPEKKYEILFHREAAAHFERLKQSHQKNPASPNGVLYAAVRNKVLELQAGVQPHHRLGNIPQIGDLSDCDTDYIWTDENEKPTHRMITRPVPRRSFDALPQRQIIAIGRREKELAYQKAVQNLGREPYLTLDEILARNVERAKTAKLKLQSKLEHQTHQPNPAEHQMG